MRIPWTFAVRKRIDADADCTTNKKDPSGGSDASGTYTRYHDDVMHLLKRFSLMGNLSQDSHPSGGASHHHVIYQVYIPVKAASDSG
jgi:hypothetical protein